tara:strand:- start:2391 stop:2939 length:549 start_codon:yes stop_codon:yes gene_type:complete
MDFDDRLKLTFMVLYGATTYVGKSDMLAPYNENDIDLIKRSTNDHSYVKESVQISLDLCDYVERTPREDISVTYLIEEGYRSHDLELENKKQFRRDLYAALSPNARADFDEKIETAQLTGDTGNGTTYRQPASDGVPDKEAYLDDYEQRVCKNVRKLHAEYVAKNWVEEPQMRAMEYRGVEK